MNPRDIYLIVGFLAAIVGWSMCSYALYLIFGWAGVLLSTGLPLFQWGVWTASLMYEV